MPFFQDLSEPEKGIARRRGLFFLLLLNAFAAVLIVSYGISAWRDLKGLIGLEPKLEITITGEGKVTARPDVARVAASIVVERETLAEAQAESSRRTAALSDYLKGQGIAEADIKTTGYHIFPQYSYPRPCPLGSGYPCPPDERPRIVGYQVRVSYEVSVRDIAKAGEILSGMVASGVNEVSGLSFTMDQPEALRAEARKKAIDEAKTKAERLARDLSRRLGRIVNFSESGVLPPPIVLERGLALGKGGDIAPSIEPGENEIVVTVSITYEFK